MAIHGFVRRPMDCFVPRNDEGGWRNDEGGWRNDEGGWRNDEGGWRNDESWVVITLRARHSRA